MNKIAGRFYCFDCDTHYADVFVDEADTSKRRCIPWLHYVSGSE